MRCRWGTTRPGADVTGPGAEARAALPPGGPAGHGPDGVTSTGRITLVAVARRMPLRRWPHVVLWLAVATGLAVGKGGAETAKYPDRPVKMMVGFSAGGGTDVIARIVAQKTTDGLGQSVLVENRPGASGMIAAEAVAK